MGLVRPLGHGSIGLSCLTTVESDEKLIRKL